MRSGGRETERKCGGWKDQRVPARGGFDLLMWLQQLRVHQYAKNGLVFVPVLTAHAFAPSALSASCLAFAAFCLCASGAYIINDLVDVAVDRQHPTKRNRPLAQGSITRGQAQGATALLLASAFL